MKPFSLTNCAAGALVAFVVVAISTAVLFAHVYVALQAGTPLKPAAILAVLALIFCVAAVGSVLTAYLCRKLASRFL